MDSWEQYKENFRLRGVVWTGGHFLYEFTFLRRLVSPIVNFFKPEYMMVGTNKMYIDKNDRVVSAKLLLDGVWEEYETEMFKNHLKSGDIVLDIGANIGYHTLIAAEIVGKSGKVYAFEPEPRNFALLKKNVEANNYKNVILINKALANKSGRFKLYLSNEDNFGDFRIFDSQDNRKYVEVEMATLDDCKIPKVDVIKMDVQGAEVLVLKGAKKTLAKQKRLRMFTEFWPKALKLAGSSARGYLDILRRNKFEIYEIDGLAKRVKKTTIKSLLANYPEDSLYNADLLCTMGLDKPRS